MQPRQAPPEHPFPEYPYQSPLLRFLTNIREHGFALALVVVMLAALGVFFHIEQSRLAELARQARPIPGETAPAVFGPVAADSSAVLTVDTYPRRAALFLDGTPIGLTPVRQISLPPGRYRLEIVKDQYAPVDSVITVMAGQRAMMSIPLDAVGDPVRPWIVTTGPEPPPAQRTEQPEPRSRQTRRADTQSAPTPPPPPPAPEPIPTASVQDLSSGRLELRSEPAGAAVWMDDRFVGYTPLVLARVSPGEHVLAFRKMGYETPTTLVVVQPGQSTTVSPRLNALAGTLKVLAKPWGSIYVNGELVRESTNVRYTAELPPGQYRVTVVHPVLGRWETFADIRPGQESSFVVDLNQSQPPDAGR